VDIHALASLGGIDVPTGLAAAKAIDRSFDGITSIRALLNVGSAAMQRDQAGWAQAVDLGQLPALHPGRGLSRGGPER
jgi:hypothetical protein